MVRLRQKLEKIYNDSMSERQRESVNKSKEEFRALDLLRLVSPCSILSHTIYMMGFGYTKEN